MDWEESLMIVLTALGSVGGAGAIILALSSWLGKVWASRILEADRAKYQRQLNTLMRYSQVQFELYNAVWVSLSSCRRRRFMGTCKPRECKTVFKTTKSG